MPLLSAYHHTYLLSRGTVSSAYNPDIWSSKSFSCFFMSWCFQANATITTINMINAGKSHQQKPSVVCSNIYDMFNPPSRYLAAWF